MFQLCLGVDPRSSCVVLLLCHPLDAWRDNCLSNVGKISCCYCWL